MLEKVEYLKAYLPDIKRIEKKFQETTDSLFSLISFSASLAIYMEYIEERTTDESLEGIIRERRLDLLEMYQSGEMILQNSKMFIKTLESLEVESKKAILVTFPTIKNRMTVKERRVLKSQKG
jgi:hypothetical protein